LTCCNVAMIVSGAAAGALGVGLAIGWTLPGGPFQTARVLAASHPVQQTAAILLSIGAAAGLLAARSDHHDSQPAAPHPRWSEPSP
jgi:hypothetical protein